MYSYIESQHYLKKNNIANFGHCSRACERTVSGSENGAERDENRLVRSG